MGAGYLFGWNGSNWVKIECDADGKLITDAITAAYTDADARAAIGNIYAADGKRTDHIYCEGWAFVDIGYMYFQDIDDEGFTSLWYLKDSPCEFRMWVRDDLGAFTDFKWQMYLTDHYSEVIHYDILLEKIVAAKGDQWHTIPGTDFVIRNPYADSHEYWVDGTIRVQYDDRHVCCAVLLPDGATITSVEVMGNAGASSQTWILNRVTLSDMSTDAMATALVTATDTSISYATIDMSLYMYVISILLLDNLDEIQWARIKYTL